MGNPLFLFVVMGAALVALAYFAHSLAGQFQ
jgi:hypothetical protein